MYLSATYQTSCQALLRKTKLKVWTLKELQKLIRLLSPRFVASMEESSRLYENWPLNPLLYKNLQKPYKALLMPLNFQM